MNRWLTLGIVAAAAALSVLPAIGGLPWLPPLVVVAAVLVWRWSTGRERQDLYRFGVLVVSATLLLAAFSWQDAFPVNYLVGTWVTILIYAIFTLGLSLQFSYCGLINFGHVASMGLGAYAVALLTGVLPNTGEVRLLTALMVGLVAGISAAILLWRRVDWDKRARSLAALALVAATTLATTIVWRAFLGSFNIYVGAILTGLVLAVGWAYIIGVPTLRLREDYLAIVTIAAAEIFRITIKSEDEFTRGSAGVVDIPYPFAGLETLLAPLGIGSSQTTTIAIVALLVLALVVWILHRLVQSPWGRLVKAIGDDEDAAESLGAPVISLKMQVLALGSIIAALAGALLTWQFLSMQPDRLRPEPTFYAWAILILGGLGSLRGAIAGSAVFWGIFIGPRWIPFDTLGIPVDSQQVAALQVLLMGLMLMGLVLVKPEGLFGDREELEVMT